MPLYLKIFPVVDDVAINIGLEISPILLGSLVVIAPATVGERKYTTPILKLFNPITLPSKTTLKSLPLTDCIKPKTSAFCAELACALYQVPVSNRTTSPIEKPCET